MVSPLTAPLSQTLFLETDEQLESTIEMREFLVISFVLLVAFVAYFAYVADQWLGVVAFTYRYLLFCITASLVLSAAWFANFRKHTLQFGLVVFSLLAANFFLPPPSARLLRSAMLKTPPGTDADAIEAIVKQEYEGSAYALPSISKDRARQFERVHVSLLSQKSRDCTALLFLIEDGVVVRSIFSPD